TADPAELACDEKCLRVLAIDDETVARPGERREKLAQHLARAGVTFVRVFGGTLGRRCRLDCAIVTHAPAPPPLPSQVCQLLARTRWRLARHQPASKAHLQVRARLPRLLRPPCR